jgi:hypothetical protein
MCFKVWKNYLKRVKMTTMIYPELHLDLKPSKSHLD